MRNKPFTPSLRDLPPRDRVHALREQIAARFGARVVGFPRTPRPARRHGKAAHSIALAFGLLAAAIAFAPVPAAHAGTLRLDLNLASIHTEQWARDSLNQRNPGVGATYQFNRTWAVAGGIYSNSYRRPTAYVLAEWTPLHVGQAGGWHVDAGIAAGLASGYTRAEIPCAPLAGAGLLRITAPDGIAANIVAVPNMGAYRSGFIGFQVSIPLRRDERAD